MAITAARPRTSLTTSRAVDNASPLRSLEAAVSCRRSERKGRQSGRRPVETQSERDRAKPEGQDRPRVVTSRVQATHTGRPVRLAALAAALPCRIVAAKRRVSAPPLPIACAGGRAAAASRSGVDPHLPRRGHGLTEEHVARVRQRGRYGVVLPPGVVDQCARQGLVAAGTGRTPRCLCQRARARSTSSWLEGTVRGGRRRASRAGAGGFLR